MDWYDSLSFFRSPTFEKITGFLAEQRAAGKTILPADKDILNAYFYTPLDQVKVVILGQDPYPNPNYPEGLAFSVQPHVRPLPKSLANIFTELVADTGCPRPSSGSLVAWAEQGVLLLNTSLTVEAGRPASHAGLGWGELVAETLALLNEERRDVVFILWGRHAQEAAVGVSRVRHCVIESAHPSPFSAARGFFGSKPFSKTNAFLHGRGIQPVNWGLTPTEKPLPS